MSGGTVETALAVWADRHPPVSMVVDQVKALDACDAVDGVLLCDQMSGDLPQQLWTPENTPLANVMGDPDSHPDVFVMAAHLLASAPRLNLTVSTDSGAAPAELVQTMLTLAGITQGRATFHVGGDEVKQCKPFGHNRAQGISRMEDLFRIFHALLDSDGPIDYRGRRWTGSRSPARRCGRPPSGSRRHVRRSFATWSARAATRSSSGSGSGSR